MNDLRVVHLANGCHRLSKVVQTYSIPPSTASSHHPRREKMNKVLIALACVVSFSVSAPSLAAGTATPLPVCKDGTTAKKAGKGSCMGHGGVNINMTDAKTDGSTSTPVPKAKP
jgi:hypothetical protein